MYSDPGGVIEKFSDPVHIMDYDYLILLEISDGDIYLSTIEDTRKPVYSFLSQQVKEIAATWHKLKTIELPYGIKAVILKNQR